MSYMSVNLERDLEIRWKLLCIYYNQLYSQERTRPDTKIKLAQDEGIEQKVVNANIIYLLDEGLLRGTISYTTGGQVPFVSRIYSRGMKLVENLYEKSQESLNEETKSKLEGIESNVERVLTWIKLCIQCKHVVPEILNLMKDTPLD